MVGTRNIGRSIAICAIALGLAVMTAPVFAQTGQVKGKVVDAQDKPVEGAKITIAQTDGGSRKLELKSKRGGDYLQIGLPPGDYTITAEKDGLKQSIPVRIGLDMKEVNFTLRPGGSSGSKEEEAKNAAKIAGLRAAFAEGAALSNAGKHDEAIAKFNEVLADVPKCAECYVNIGSTYAQKKDYEQSEAAFKKALEIDPNSADAYNGLARVYNDQKKFTEAQAMSAEAAKRAPAGATAGASADNLYNQGVISWNSNDFAKAQEHFAAAVAADPNHAESHFMLGRVYLNLGKLPEAAKEFETYVKIAPTGRNAKEAQTNFDALKQYIK
jgi:Flp pilus assembly protein TadD